jgi:hypothetical protein
MERGARLPMNVYSEKWVKKREVQSMLAGNLTTEELETCHKRADVPCDIEIDEDGNTTIELLPEEETNVENIEYGTETANIVTTNSARAPSPTMMTEPRPAIRAEAIMVTATML